MQMFRDISYVAQLYQSEWHLAQCSLFPVSGFEEGSDSFCLIKLIHFAVFHANHLPASRSRG